MDVFKYTVCVFIHVHNHPLVSTRDWFQDPSSYLNCQETRAFSEKVLPLQSPFFCMGQVHAHLFMTPSTMWTPWEFLQCLVAGWGRAIKTSVHVWHRCNYFFLHTCLPAFDWIHTCGTSQYWGADHVEMSPRIRFPLFFSDSPPDLLRVNSWVRVYNIFL